MEKEEFSKKWRRLKTSEERRQFLSDELKNELGSFDAFQNRLPTIRTRGQAYAYVEEYPFMKYNNLHAQQVEFIMFGGRGKVDCRDDKSTIVNKIVEEMTNIPALIEDFTPSTSQLLKTQENGTSKRPKSSMDYYAYKRQKTDSSKNEQPQNNHSKSSTSNESTNRLDVKPQRIDQKSPIDQKTNNRRTHSPKNNKKKVGNSVDNINHKKLDSLPSTSSNNQIPKIELSTISPSTSQSKPEAHSRPSSSHADSGKELFVCKFPSYAIGEYVGYRIRKPNKSPDLPDSIVSINVRKMPNVKDIMVQVKQCILKASKVNKIQSPELTCALYLCGLMLYAVYESPPTGVNDLLREVLSILSTIRSTFLPDTPQCKQLKNYSIVSNMIYLADSHLCERLYENTFESSLRRRQLLEECRPSFSTFDTNEELMPKNFGNLLDNKDQSIFTDTLSDLCSKDKINIPKLYFQLLLENSQHSMLHERHVYSKRLAIQQMESLEPALWKCLTKDMKLKLDGNSCTEIADAIFSLVHWIGQEKK